uniref:Putative calcineurin-like phosphoesterase n=1 Tax=viral metagenome TaxID=1070528 RepID=A0A6M3LDM3_9ZZZZ
MDDLTDAKEWAKYRTEIDELRRAYKRLSEQAAKRSTAESILERAALASFADLPPVQVAKPRKDGRKKAAEVAVVCCADWHYGALTPDFDTKVCRKRVMEYAGRITEITAVQRSDHPIREAHVYWLGDIVAGEQIHAQQPYQLDVSLIDQAVTDGVALVRDFLLRLMECFDTIHTFWIPGNHGRIGPRKGAAFHPDSNADRALGLVAAQWFNGAKLSDRISFTVARAERGDVGSFLVDRIGEYRAMLIHGHQMRGGGGWGGLPFYGFSRAGLSWRNIATGGQLPEFDDIYLGHFHRVYRLNAGTVTMRGCGTLQTQDPYSREEIKAYTEPSQLLVFVHPKGRVTAEYEVDLL